MGRNHSNSFSLFFSGFFGKNPRRVGLDVAVSRRLQYDVGLDRRKLVGCDRPSVRDCPQTTLLLPIQKHTTDMETARSLFDIQSHFFLRPKRSKCLAFISHCMGTQAWLRHVDSSSTQKKPHGRMVSFTRMCRHRLEANASALQRSHSHEPSTRAQTEKNCPFSKIRRLSVLLCGTRSKLYVDSPTSTR